ncbi:MAG: hypothetical protein NC311_00090 [Muribaculaceae bacterium]|nr:hypothetical protein [Muribaculaceae bacterium]
MADLTALYDIISGAIGAASGALVTALANRQKNQSLRDKVVVSTRELDKIRLENDKLLRLIEDRETQILEMERTIADMRPTKTRTRRQKN